MEQGAKNMTSASAKVSKDAEKMTSEVQRQTKELDEVSQNATKITDSLKEFRVRPAHRISFNDYQ